MAAKATKSLKILHAKKEAIFSRIQRIYDISKLTADKATAKTFLSEIAYIDRLRSDFESVLNSIFELELDLDDEYIVSYEPLMSLDELICYAKREADLLQLQSVPHCSNLQTKTPKLPPIEIPEFDGDVRKWQLFHASYLNVVHNNTTLTDSERIFYLLGKLKGKALNVCAGITPSGENYMLIYEALKNKYEDKRLIATSYLDQIFEFKSISNASSANLELFVDNIATAVAALKNLKFDDLTDFIFTYIAFKKLDSDTTRSFELANRGSDVLKFDELINYLREHIKILQRTTLPKGDVTSKDRRTITPKPRVSTHAYVNIASASRSQSNCLLCSLSHNHMYECSVFHKMDPSKRFDFVKHNGLCINCLSDKHRVSACNSNSRCKTCSNKHHSMLHFSNSKPVSPPAKCSTPQRPPPADPALEWQVKRTRSPPRASSSDGCISRSDDVTLCSSDINPYNGTTVLLATARVMVIDSRGKEHNIRILLDSASQSNFITRECCQRLNLIFRLQPCNAKVKGIDGSMKAIEGLTNIKFYSRFNRNIVFDTQCLVVDKITERLPSALIDTSALDNFANLPLADNTYSVPGDIEMLIGASLFSHLILPHKVKGRSAHLSPYALETLLGYVIMGNAPARLNEYATLSHCCVEDSMESIMRKFWEVEEVNVPCNLSADDNSCEDIYARTTTRDPDGRYVVALPFKGDVFSLGHSLEMATKRFLCLERRMIASPKLRLAYNDIIKEYLSKNYISLVPCHNEDPLESPSYIIPHHGVIREDKVTSKLRVVLDASAKTSSHVSLNEILYGGQNLQGNLFDIIVNFRLFKIAFSADVRQMFLSIGVRESDRRFQRILYRFSPHEPLRVYEFNRVCFGLRSSPFLALRTIKQLAADEGALFPKARKTIETGLYMDDVIYSIDSEEEAVATASEVIGLMKAGQFDLVKWTSNSQTVLNSIPLSHRLSSVKEFDESDSHKVLGLCWSPATDLFRLTICKPASTCTKRTILSCVARIWDVMGFIAPVVLYAKLLIKQLWLCSCDWDSRPPEEIVRLWSHFRSELHLLSQVCIPRHVNIARDSEVTIIGFADASERAYGGVVYFQVCNDKNISVHLISAKSKVSPRKVVSLARLELLAILVLAKLINTIVKACNSRIKINNVYAFSDSTVALCWAHSSPHRWDTFVANRVSKIQQDMSPDNLYHVSGTDNPADCLSRGLTPAQIINHPLWFHGPSWTHLKPSLWPIVKFNPSTVSEPLEEKKYSLIVTAPLEDSLIIALSRKFSSWSKYLRSVVYVCRFSKLLKTGNIITASDLNFAETLVLRELQRKYFSNDFRLLQLAKPCSRTLQRLRPFLDVGLIRVGGRLANANLTFSQKHPIILPRKDHILDLIVDYHHKLYCHAGPDLLMSILRHKYWILSARNLIRIRVHKCVPCFRLRPKPTYPEMANHRSCRVVETVKPFVHTGTDYAGPFKITITRGRGVKSFKAYICLFVCLTTRAVHIELVGDLSTASFLGAFKRFLSRRGPVSRVYSDNGTNYIGAKRTLSELQIFLASKYYNSEFAQVLSNNRIEWSLNTPTACHFGGNWETNIKSLKTHLFRVIGAQILTYEEMSTLLAQIEAVMNTRPLCRTLSSDPSEPLALTPSHFLNLTPLKFLPAEDVDETRLHLLTRHALLDRLVQSFWKRWRSDYLHTLQSRQKWNTPANPITVGTIVILTTDNAPPLHWPLGIVEEIFPDSHGVTRIVRIRTATGSYLRPVVRLCPLPSQ